ncbi:hypothetical protein AX14_013470 [Amanita brunnescens Koide BX004]|nr:hypothetical protein AX14_013470 [Amanita brunnescens Koide BX004]
MGHVVGAKLPHLAKYMDGYDQLYPAATQVLIRSEATTFFKPNWMNRASLRKVVEALEALGCIIPRNRKVVALQGATKHRIIIHTFSNGGCLQLTTLGTQLSHHKSNTSVSTIIFDSCPGTTSYSATLRAFNTMIHFAPLRVLLAIYLYVSFTLFTVRKYLFGAPSFWERRRIQLNQPSVLPWLTKSSPRLYIYSTRDNMIRWQDVESHAKDAEEWCAHVRKERFEDTGHVAHMRKDPERYWGVIKEVWSAACKAGD